MTNKLSKSKRTGLEIAVIGIAGRFPGSKDIDTFWENLRNGVESISFLTDEELDELKISSELRENPQYVRSKGGVLEDKECFDAQFFGYTPSEAQVMDPQIRIFHECCWQALENAGYNSENYEGSIGLYAGNSTNLSWEAWTLLSGKAGAIGRFSASHLTGRDFLATRISYKLNLKGPSVQVQSACSTSLVAIHLACRALLTGECKIALAGGVTVAHEKSRGYLYKDGMVSSADGRCRAFAAGSTGTVFGSGAGVVVLKPLKDALSSGDNIYAVVKGSAINNDGIRKVGYSAPSVKGQIEVIRAAQRFSRVEPESITYVETHGTGTELGDPIEVQALTQAFDTDKRNYCGIGSVKTNVGHLDAAAGVTGFIKTVLSLKNRLIPPSLNFEKPNPKIDFENSPFFVNSQLKEWTNPDYPLRAGVSSFGIGGTNAPILFEEAPPRDDPPPSSRAHQLILISAGSEKTLKQAQLNLASYLTNHPEGEKLALADVAYTLQMGRKSFAHRSIFVCTSREELVAALDDGDEEPVNGFYCGNETPPVYFMFSGQGSQYANMGLGLYQQEKFFRDELDSCLEALTRITGRDFKPILFPQEQDSDSLEKINQFVNTSPIKFVFEYSLARLLMHWGVEPRAMIGHSFGEYIAACLSGVFSLEDALKLVALRGKLLHEMPEGAILSVPLGEEEARKHMGQNLDMAAVNSPYHCIVSGTLAHIDEFEQKMKDLGHECAHLRVPRAAHSRMMEPILEPFKKAAAELTFNKPRIPYVSGLTGQWIKPEEAMDPGYWARHLRETIRFSDGLDLLLSGEKAVFVQIGSDRSLSSFLEIHPKRKPGDAVLNTIRHPKDQVDDGYFIFNILGRLWQYGVKPNWEKLFDSEKRSRVPLPTYPFDRKYFWIDWDPSKLGLQLMAGGGLAKKGDIADWFYLPSWQRFSISGKEILQSQEQFNWLVFVDEFGLGDRLVQRLVQNGHEVTMVRKGTGFSRAKKGEFKLDPACMEDYTSLVDILKKEGNLPSKIVHLWSVTGILSNEPSIQRVEEFMAQGFYSLFYLVKAMGVREVNSDIQIQAVTDNMQEVTGGDLLYPEKSTIIGPIRVIPQEFSNISCSSVDIVLPVKESREEEQLINHLIAEFDILSSEPVVAFRGNHRWEQTFKPLRLEETENGNLRLKENGVYIVTGGMTGIGYQLAKFIATTTKSKLILLGRSQMPQRNEWSDWLKTHEEDEKISLRIKNILDLEEMGSEVLPISADIADEEVMSKALESARQQFGPVNGVIHAGGVPGGGAIQFQTRESVEEVLRPKVRGTLVLHSLVKDENLDFFIHCSSGSSIIPGFGQVEYCAANAFLDAYAEYEASVNGGIMIAIDWGRWNDTGMTVAMAKKHKERTGRDLMGGINPDEGVVAFSRLLHWDFPRIIVNEKDLLVEIREFTKNKENWDNGDNKEEKSGDSDTSSLKMYQRPQLSTKYVAPQNQLEEQVAGVWARFFGYEEVGVEDNFFELGGDSLKATMLVSIIHKELDLKVPLTRVFNSPTIRELLQDDQEVTHESFTAIARVEQKEYYPLASAQKRLYFLDQFENIGSSYNVPAFYSIYGKLDKVRLEKAFKDLIQRHETFRTSFIQVDSIPYQRVYDSVEFAIEDVTVTSPEDKEEVKKAVYAFIRPFDLSKAPLLRVGLITLGESEYILLYDMHHIISDGSSVNILIEDFLSLYAGANLVELGIQYKDFCAWQNDYIQMGKIRDQELFWTGEFDDNVPALNLPGDFPRPDIQSYRGDEYHFAIESSQTSQLNSLAAEEKATLFVVLLAVFDVLLFKLSGQEDIVVGTPIAGRRHADLDRIIGMFVNTLALRSFPSGDKTFREFLREVKDKTFQAFENQDYQFEELVEKIKLTRDTSRNPLFDVKFVLQNMEAATLDEELKGDVDFKVSKFGFDIKTSKFDISMDAVEAKEKLFFFIEYSTSLFKRTTIQRFMAYFEKIIDGILQNPDGKLKDIDMITREEKEQILGEFNDTAAPFPEDKTIHDMFAEQVQRTPGKTAVVYEDSYLSYTGLDQISNRVANYLALGRGVLPEQRVAVLMERCDMLIPAVFGTLKAGCAYLPIDPSLPEERIKNMIIDAQVGVILSQEKFIRTLNRLQWECPDLHSFMCLDSRDVYGAEESEKSGLMDSKLWEYVGETATDEITGGGWLTSYTGLPFTKEEMDEYGENILQKLQPLLKKDMRVLEIGCASGITMFRVAPQVSGYHGIDISDVIIKKNRQRAEQEGHENVSLACMAAHEIDSLAPGSFDLVIINSVIHCFHGHNYLRDVLEKVYNLLDRKGLIFLGDLMDQELKQNLIDDMAGFKRENQGKNYKTKTDWSTELFVSRTFLEDLAVQKPQIYKIQYSNKIYTIENELTRYRYDALLEVDKGIDDASGKTRLKYQHDLGELEKYSFDKEFAPTKPGNLAYVIYTSGSTGVPKGVMIEHRAVINRLNWMQRMYPIGVEDMILQKTPIVFDVSVWELFWWSFQGATLTLLAPGGEKSPEAIARKINDNGVTTMHFVPSMLNAFLDYLESSVEFDGLPGLKQVFASGEALGTNQAERFNRLLFDSHGTRLINLYGPTEAAVDVSYFTASPLGEWATVPIGKPVENTRLLILDEALHLKPIGMPGELHIGGVQLARGYLKREELTREKFIDDPFNPGERLYKTGDLVRWLDDGNIEFIGRIDQQVKIRGFRIELGEIENRLLAHEDIKDVVIVAAGGNEESKEDRYLAAYFTSPGKPEIPVLREFLSQTLPSYMVPTYFMQLEEIPLSNNGKVNFKLLPDPRKKLSAAVEKEKRTPEEEKIITIWADNLGLDAQAISINDNFFELGGNSLNILRVKNRISTDFDLDIPISKLFLFPVLRDLAANVYEQTVLGKLECMVKLNNGHNEKNIFILHPLHGMVFQYKELAGLLEDSFNVYGIQHRGLVKKSWMPDNFDLMVADYVQQILQVQKEGPFIIMGFCFGDILAYHVVKLLEHMGLEVELLIMCDEAEFYKLSLLLTRRLKDRIDSIELALKNAVTFFKKNKSIPRALRSYGELVKQVQEKEEEGAKDVLPEEIGQQRLKVKLNIREVVQKHFRGSLSKSLTGIIHAPIVNIDAKESRYITGSPSMNQLTYSTYTVEETTGGHDSMFEIPHVERVAQLVKKYACPKTGEKK